MANIKVELSHEIIDGQPVTLVAPCDCTAITGLKVMYPGGSKIFTFKDAHGNVLTGLGNLFSKGVYVKAILDATNRFAYIQNADTNAYLEAMLESKAPAGYGLGGNAVPIDSLDNATKFGLTQSNVGTPTVAMWDCLTIPFDSLYATQIAYKTNDTTVDICVRKKQNGTWGEWEWDNPPLIKGVEYRTTDRWHGSPVYKQHVNIGYLPNTSMKQVSFAGDGTAIACKFYGYAKSGGKTITLPYLTNVTLGITKGRIVVNTDTDYSDYYGSVIVEYIKT